MNYFFYLMFIFEFDKLSQMLSFCLISGNDNGKMLFDAIYYDYKPI